MENGHYYSTDGNEYLIHLNKMYQLEPNTHHTLAPWNIEWAEMRVGWLEWIRIRILHWILRIEG